jgi:DNA polymerase III epsilon subunit family exonuclease
MTWLRPLWRWPRRRGPSLDALVTEGFVAIDLETTGLDSRTDAVVAAAAIEIVAGDPRPGYATLVNPGRPIPPTATAVHGITDAAVAFAPRIEEVLDAFEAACGDRVLVGHRIEFDLAILARERRLRGRPAPRNAAICTMRLAAALYPSWGDVGLDAVAARVAVPIPDRHTARGDALASARILLAMLPEARRRGIRTLDELIWLLSTASLHG